MKAHTYIIDGVAVANPKLMPEMAQFEKYSIVQTITDIDGYNEALAKWKENCIEVENVEWSEGNPLVNFKLEDGTYNGWQEITDGQQVEMEGNKIIRIL